MATPTRHPRHTWTVAEAKAKLSEVIASAGAHGAQVITRRGHPAAIVVSPAAWTEYTRSPASLAEMLAPVRGLGPLSEPEKQPWTEPRL